MIIKVDIVVVHQQFAVIVGITVVKCIVLPGIGVCIVKGVIRLRLIHPDPLYEFLLLLQFALPPAVSLTRVKALLSAGPRNHSCSSICLWFYDYDSERKMNHGQSKGEINEKRKCKKDERKRRTRTKRMCEEEREMNVVME
ncbi:hypothetical protein V8G54_010452 [Vigna mungo]|uniref:Uncharacterized protein n=1 Tax=Vigna mungo TaxID=3915 RepID=A0AAQ3NY17_VIGMU